MFVDTQCESKVEAPTLPVETVQPYQVLLLHAATMLETGGWCQGAWYHMKADSSEYESVCTGQAIRNAAAQLGIDVYGEQFNRAVHAVVKHVMPTGLIAENNINWIATWNDAKGRTKAECIAALRHAAR